MCKPIVAKSRDRHNPERIGRPNPPRLLCAAYLFPLSLKFSAK
jgi:hypothetical protein